MYAPTLNRFSNTPQSASSSIPPHNCMQNDRPGEATQDQQSQNQPPNQQQQQQPDLEQHSVFVPQGDQNQGQEEWEDEGEGRRLRQRVQQEEQRGGEAVGSGQADQQEQNQNQEGGEQDEGDQQRGGQIHDVEDRMSASRNPNQINQQGEVDQQNLAQAFQVYPPFPPMVGPARVPFIFQHMMNPQNVDVVLGVPVPPWMVPPDGQPLQNQPPLPPQQQQQQQQQQSQSHRDEQIDDDVENGNSGHGNGNHDEENP